ncbi:MAG: IS6 family transposase, partial [Magnetococcales bacterium]|nr:IS6 family transposase [Magnetococcales bacterium]
MKTAPSLYHGFRFPCEIISHAVWLYHRFTLSYRDVEEILAYRGIEVTYESIRQWSQRFGQEYAKKIRSRQGTAGDIWFLDEVFIKIKGKLHYLWRAVDQDGDNVRHGLC